MHDTDFGRNLHISKSAIPKSFLGKKLLYLLNLVLVLYVESLVRFPYEIDRCLHSLMISALPCLQCWLFYQLSQRKKGHQILILTLRCRCRVCLVGFFSASTEKMRKLAVTTTAVYWQRAFEMAVLGRKVVLGAHRNHVCSTPWIILFHWSLGCCRCIRRKHPQPQMLCSATSFEVSRE